MVVVDGEHRRKIHPERRRPVLTNLSRHTHASPKTYQRLVSGPSSRPPRGSRESDGAQHPQSSRPQRGSLECSVATALTNLHLRSQRSVTQHLTQAVYRSGICICPICSNDYAQPPSSTIRRGKEYNADQCLVSRMQRAVVDDVACRMVEDKEAFRRSLCGPPASSDAAG